MDRPVGNNFSTVTLKMQNFKSEAWLKYMIGKHSTNKCTANFPTVMDLVMLKNCQKSDRKLEMQSSNPEASMKHESGKQASYKCIANFYMAIDHVPNNLCSKKWFKCHVDHGIQDPSYNF